MMTTRAPNWIATAGLLLTLGLPGCAVEGAEDEPTLEDSESHWFSGDPVIFIHGCTPPGFTDADSVHDYDDWVAYFRARGYPDSHLVVFQNMEEQCTSITRYAEQIDDLIDATRAATGKWQVDIVAQSMGAIAVRYYFQTNGTSKVRDFVSVGGVHHGTEGGLFADLDALHWQDAFGGYPWFEGIHELFPSYACWGESWGSSGGEGSPTQNIQPRVNGCLTPTGRTIWKDETPGWVRYAAVWNTLDDIIIPQQSACLNMSRENDCSSSVNHAVTVPAGTHPGGCEAGCPAHLMMLFDPDVIRRGYNFVRGYNW
jgi:pimeloyl-ACP methyl ester carboxylesterase